MGKSEGAQWSSQDVPMMFGTSSDFVIAAHELKAPLALVRHLTLQLEQGHSDMTEAGRERVLQQIRLTTERTLRLTSDLTRAERQAELFVSEPVNPMALCEEVVHEMTPLYAAYGRRLRLVARRKDLLAVANHDLLSRVVMNFADNALHYTAEGKDVQITCRRLESEARIRIGVRDYGPTLPRAAWAGIRKSLEDGRAVPPAARARSSGLGLMIAGKFARMMNGAAGVVRHQNGTTFYIELPSSSQLSLL